MFDGVLSYNQVGAATGRTLNIDLVSLLPFLDELILAVFMLLNFPGALSRCQYALQWNILKKETKSLWFFGLIQYSLVWYIMKKWSLVFRFSGLFHHLFQWISELPIFLVHWFLWFLWFSWFSGLLDALASWFSGFSGLLVSLVYWFLWFIGFSGLLVSLVYRFFWFIGLQFCFV